MKLPPRLKIGGHNFKVSRHSSDDIGSSNYYNKSININPLYDESTQAEALLHELIEVICVGHELDLGENHKELSTLSETLFAVMRHNKLNFAEEDI